MLRVLEKEFSHIISMVSDLLLHEQVFTAYQNLLRENGTSTDQASKLQVESKWEKLKLTEETEEGFHKLTQEITDLSASFLSLHQADPISNPMKTNSDKICKLVNALTGELGNQAVTIQLSQGQNLQFSNFVTQLTEVIRKRVVNAAAPNEEKPKEETAHFVRGGRGRGRGRNGRHDNGRQNNFGRSNNSQRNHSGYRAYHSNHNNSGGYYNGNQRGNGGNYRCRGGNGGGRGGGRNFNRGGRNNNNAPTNPPSDISADNGDTYNGSSYTVTCFTCGGPHLARN